MLLTVSVLCGVLAGNGDGFSHPVAAFDMQEKQLITSVVWLSSSLMGSRLMCSRVWFGYHHISVSLHRKGSHLLSFRRFWNALGMHVQAKLARSMPADPLDPEYQRRMMDHIQQQNIETNFETAMCALPLSCNEVVGGDAPRLRGQLGELFTELAP